MRMRRRMEAGQVTSGFLYRLGQASIVIAFTCESISVLDSLGMSVNCAGYLNGYGAMEGADDG